MLSHQKAWICLSRDILKSFFSPTQRIAISGAIFYCPTTLTMSCQKAQLQANLVIANLVVAKILNIKQNQAILSGTINCRVAQINLNQAS